MKKKVTAGDAAMDYTRNLINDVQGVLKACWIRLSGQDKQTLQAEYVRVTKELEAFVDGVKNAYEADAAKEKNG